MQRKTDSRSLLGATRCPHCRHEVHDQCPACPKCGEKIYVEHPGDITPTKHEQLDILRDDKADSRATEVNDG